jgi:hypothetical protein
VKEHDGDHERNTLTDVEFCFSRCPALFHTQLPIR